MKHTIIISLLFFGIALSVKGQSAKLKKAYKLYNNRAYVEAAEILSREAKASKDLVTLGNCYYFNGLMQKAAKVYSKLDKAYWSKLSDSVTFRIAQSYFAVKNTNKADSLLQTLRTNHIPTPKFKDLLSEAVPFNYEITPVKTGVQSGDFGVSFYGEKVVFASYKENAKKTYDWNEKPYLDLYKANYKALDSFSDIAAFNDKINTKTHESNAIFSKDSTVMYFSRTNEKRHKIDERKVATVKIYKSERLENGWSIPEELPFCSNVYSTQHPALNPDEDRLYFSSDMPGGEGSFDIYYVELNDKTYGAPVNLGPKINTKHREQFPFVEKDNTLYFSSDGHQGFGSLDVLMVKKDSSNWYTPMNLGPTLNSNMDDFAFVLHPENSTGYLSSNRSGADFIYAFKRTKNKPLITVEGLVYDKNSKDPLPGTLITLFDENNKAIDSVNVDQYGRYVFKANTNSTYKLEGFKPLYIPNTKSFDTDDSGTIIIDIALALESYDDAEEIIVEKEDLYVYIELENIYFDLDQWNIKPQAAKTLDVLVNLMKKYPRMEVELSAHTDNRSSFDYNITLSENRAKAARDYVISKGIDPNRLTSIGYGESRPLVSCGNNCTDSEHAINRRCEFIITK